MNQKDCSNLRIDIILLALIPWGLLYAAIMYREYVVRQSKDPSLYVGICRKTTGYEYSCSLEQWLALDPYPGLVGILTMVGFILAAAISGAIYVALLPKEHALSRLFSDFLKGQLKNKQTRPTN